MRVFGLTLIQHFGFHALDPSNAPATTTFPRRIYPRSFSMYNKPTYSLTATTAICDVAHLSDDEDVCVACEEGRKTTTNEKSENSTPQVSAATPTSPTSKSPHCLLSPSRPSLP